MKKLLLLLLISLSVTAYRSKDFILREFGHTPWAKSVRTVTVNDLAVAGNQAKQKAMTVGEYTELAKTDPNAYHKFIESLRQPEERSEVDKLMNLLAHGKYE